MITSTHNPKLKLVRALLGRAKERRAAGAFVVEGVRLVEDAVHAGWKVRFALWDETVRGRGLSIVEQLTSRGEDVEEVSSSLMRSISETETPQGILAVLELTAVPIPDRLDFVLIPDQIRDPGNLGTLLRSASAAGVQAVFIPPETADAFAPKVVRSGMGAHFRLPIHNLGWDEIEQALGQHGLRIFIADMDGASCWETDLTQPAALIIGSEAEGASGSAAKLAKGRIRIPMSGNIESLNAGAAGSILMFEVMRQRQHNSH